MRTTQFDRGFWVAFSSLATNIPKVLLHWAAMEQPGVIPCAVPWLLNATTPYYFVNLSEAERL